MKLVIVSLAALALGGVGSVKAQGAAEVVITGTKAPAGSETRSKTVSYADLDLSKSAGLGTLLDRIRAAASDVCSPEPQSTSAKDAADFRSCVKRAVNSAVRKVDNPALTAMVFRAH